MADHMIVTYREKAENWIEQAERAQRRMYVGPMLRFKFQDASTYLELAGQCFRVAKRFQDAGVAYKHCGRLEEKQNNPEVAASFYHEAALCFQKDDPQEAANCYLSAINLFCQRQRFSTAARLECEVAELMQNDRNRRLEIVHLIKAADFYRANTCFDDAADRCLLKAAHELGLAGRYMEAASLFQEVGRRMLVDDLLKFNSPDTFLKAILCLLCESGLPKTAKKGPQRGSGAKASLPRPSVKSVQATIVTLGKGSSVFKGSRAYMFATDVAIAQKEGDLDFFAARLYAYNNVCHLDAWFLCMLKTVSDHVHAKATELRKIRAIEEKRRRRQRAEERARDRIKRLRDPSLEDESSEASSSGHRPSSEQGNTPSHGESSSKRSWSSTSSYGSGSGSSSDSDSDSDSDSSNGSSSDSSLDSNSSGSALSSSGSAGSSEDSGENSATEASAKRASRKDGDGRSKGSTGPKSSLGSDSSFSSASEASSSQYSNSRSGSGGAASNAKMNSAKSVQGKTSSSSSAEADSASESVGFSEESESGSDPGSINESGEAGKKKAGGGKKTEKNDTAKKR